MAQGDDCTRQHKRALHIDNIDIAAVPPGGSVVKVQASIANLSEGGLCVAIFLDLPEETPVVMNFNLPGGSTAVVAKGVIKWASREKNETGIEFTLLSDGLRQWVRDYIEEKPKKDESPMD